MKRGQATLFVILGIVIIATIAAAFYLSQEFAQTKSMKEASESIKLTEAELEAKNIVESCMEDLLSNGILEVFSNGGTLENTDTAKAAKMEAPIYNSELPKMEYINGQIGDYIDDNMELCLRKNSNLIISKPGKIEVNAENEKVIALSSMSIALPGSILKDFEAEIDADLEKALEDANELYGEEKETGRFVALANFSRNAVEKDYLLYAESANGHKLYLMSFKKILINGRQLEFAFAIPIEEKAMVAGVNITEIDAGIFPIFTENSEDLKI